MQIFQKMYLTTFQKYSLENKCAQFAAHKAFIFLLFEQCFLRKSIVYMRQIGRNKDISIFGKVLSRNFSENYG